MRYRPFGGGGLVVSAVSLRLKTGTSPDAVAPLMHGALEHGINYFEIPAGDPEILTAAGQALRPVDRNLLVVTLRIGGALTGASRDFSPQTLANQIVDAQRRTGIREFDGLVLDDPAAEELSPK
ncbi:MAG TPA: hypothetical protein VF686_05025, partial [Brevundimonas sp.]